MEKEIYSKIKTVELEKFKIAKYIVISKEPEYDANSYMDRWAEQNELNQIEGYKKRKIGWDFPVSKEQSEKFGMHGYVSAYILPNDFEPKIAGVDIVEVDEDTYATLTITDPMSEPWNNIPIGYDKLLHNSEIKTLVWEDRVFDSWGKRISFEEIYTKNGVEYMDIFIPISRNEA